MFSTLGDIIEYTGGIFEYTAESVKYSGQTMSTPGDTMMSVEGYHEYTGDTMTSVEDIMKHRGMFSTLGFPYKFDCFLNYLPPHLSRYHGIPQCTEHPPVYS